MAQATVRRAFSAGETVIVESEPCRAACFVAAWWPNSPIWRWRSCATLTG
jgi:hypothetical protein